MTLFRAATAHDIAAVLALWQEPGVERSHTDDADSVRRLIEHDAGALIVAVDDDRIVGSVIAAWDGWRGSIYRLAVAADHRRHGLGRRLLTAAEERLDAVGAARGQAIVVEVDVRAVAFWQASGWTQQSERLRFVR